MARSATRRQFLKTSAIASTSLFAAPAILRAKNVNEKLNVACIGVGGRGGAHLPGAGRRERHRNLRCLRADAGQG